MEKCIRVNISLSPEICNLLDQQCAKYGCPRSTYIAMAIKYKADIDTSVDRMPEIISLLKDFNPAMMSASDSDIDDKV